jgi:hypothetical protein
MQDIIQRAKALIPSLDDILSEAMENIEVEKVANRFGEVLVHLDELATDIYRKYEREAIRKLAIEWIKRQKEDIKGKMEEILSQEGWDKFIEKATMLFADFGFLVQALEKDLGNMRKARGGKTFEKAVLKLLELIGIKGETPRRQARENLQRIDIVIPSIEVALETPDRAFFLACKRTLRERWKQEVPSAQPNWRIYLITIDENLPENKANEIKSRGLIAFVRDSLKDEEHLKEKSWIRKLSDLPKELTLR